MVVSEYILVESHWIVVAVLGSLERTAQSKGRFGERERQRDGRQEE